MDRIVVVVAATWVEIANFECCLNTCGQKCAIRPQAADIERDGLVACRAIAIDGFRTKLISIGVDRFTISWIGKYLGACGITEVPLIFQALPFPHAGAEVIDPLAPCDLVIVQERPDPPFITVSAIIPDR